MKHSPQTPPQHRLYVIGDIHGRLDLLERLLSMIEADALGHDKTHKKLIFVGDYVDRGLDSRGVITRLLKKFTAGLEPIFLRGNHDEMFLRFAQGDFEIAQAWLSLGGTAALASYSIRTLGYTDKAQMQTLHSEVQSKVPSEHIAFLENTVLSATFGDYYFVHAGIKPGVPLEKQDPIDQMTIRGAFLFCEDEFDKVIIHGHTIRPEPEVKHNRIGIDTGAFATGCLTCLILDGSSHTFLST